MVNDIPFSKKTRNVHSHFVGESTIEDVDLKNLLSAYCKHIGSRSTDALRELMKRDPVVNDTPFFQKDAQ